MEKSNKDDILNICSDLFDRITVVKGYLELNNERKKVDYSLVILQEINDFERIIMNLVNLVNNDSNNE